MFNVTSKSDKTNYLYVQGARATADKNDTSGMILQNFNKDIGQKNNLASITSQITHLTDSNNAGDLMFKTMCNDNLEERMRLDARGHLGINTSSPEELLTVNGNTYVRSNLYVDQDIKTTKLVFEPHNQTVRSIGDDMFANITFADDQNNYVRNISTIDDADNMTTSSYLRCKHISSSSEVVSNDTHESSAARLQVPLNLEEGRRYEITLAFQLHDQSTNTARNNTYVHVYGRLNNTENLFDAIEHIPIEYDESTDTVIRASPIKNIHMFYEKRDSTNETFELLFEPVSKNTKAAIGYTFLKVHDIT